MVSVRILSFVCFVFLCGHVTGANTGFPRRSLFLLEMIDVNKMLQNNRIMNNYVRCFIGKGPCSPEARDFKKMIPKMSATACGFCTDNQKTIVKKLFLFIYEKKPNDWKKLKEVFDPQGKNTKIMDEFLGISST